jgi:ElaB/YqjD/DUF883 family membrane-anchored ribosome-binding protein
MRQPIRVALAGVVLALVLVACDGSGDALSNLQKRLQDDVDAVRSAISNAADSIDAATRPTYEKVVSGVDDLRSDLEAAANETGDRADQAYQDLLRRAQDLLAQGEAAGDRASAQAQDAWRAVSDALAELEAEIRDAANGS